MEPNGSQGQCNSSVPKKTTSKMESTKRINNSAAATLVKNDIAADCDLESQRAPSPVRLYGWKPGSPSFRRENSTRSLKYDWRIAGSDTGSHMGSVRSWASVGMGSTDGKKMIVRRVPTSPVELFNIVNPPT